MDGVLWTVDRVISALRALACCVFVCVCVSGARIQSIDVCDCDCDSDCG